jgi:hypothetical protein
MIPIPGINSLIEGVGNIISKFKHSPAEKATAMLELGKLHHTMVQESLKFEIEQVQAQASIILAEAKAGWLTRNWRPMLMIVFMVIIVNNFLVWPYSQELGIVAKQLDFPVWMQDLLKIGVGGYIGGRSAEKIIPATVAAWKGSKSES